MSSVHSKNKSFAVPICLVVLVVGSKGSNLNHIGLWCLSIIVANVRWVCFIASNDENNGRGVECHPFLRPVITALGHHYGAYWLAGAGQGVILNAALQMGQAEAQQLQQAAPKLTKNKHTCKRKMRHKCILCVQDILMLVQQDINIISNLNYRSRVYLLHLPAHEAIYNWVISCAGLGEEWGNDGNSGRDGILIAKSYQHRDQDIGCPAHQITENHNQEHSSQLLLIA